MERILQKYLSIPTEEISVKGLRSGDRVRLNPILVDCLKTYYIENRYNKNANPKWLKMGKILLNEKDKTWFSLLHIADEKSAYPKGTAIIEIGVNQDIEIRADALDLSA